MPGSCEIEAYMSVFFHFLLWECEGKAAANALRWSVSCVIPLLRTVHDIITENRFIACRQVSWCQSRKVLWAGATTNAPELHEYFFIRLCFPPIFLSLHDAFYFFFPLSISFYQGCQVLFDEATVPSSRWLCSSSPALHSASRFNVMLRAAHFGGQEDRFKPPIRHRGIQSRED